MEHRVVPKLVAGLKNGALAPADPRDLDAAVRTMADELAGPAQAPDGVRAALTALNDERHFEHTRTLGKAWIDCQAFDATITRRYAQALIDLFELDPAEALLTDALSRARADSADAQARAEIPEYLGLLGRIEKQHFIRTGDKQRLVNATNRYLAQLEGERDSGNWFWHGINAVALGAREQRAGVVPADRRTAVPDAAEIYKRMVKLYRTTPNDPWVPATASEAALALGRCDSAELWLYRFLHHPRVKPFYVQSYDRQLREIWEGDPTGGSRCADKLARISARHILRTQSQFTIATAAIPALKASLEGQSAEAQLEKNFLSESTFSLASVRDMLDACSSIGCVSNTTGARLGTGFLVDGDWLGFPAAGPVFITNAHVISATVPKAIPPAQARVSFEVESELAGMPLFYKVGEVLYTSPPGKLGVSSDEALDFTVVTLAADRPCGEQSGLKMATALPLVENKAKAYVVGHPLGSGLQISLHDSVLLDIDEAERLVHYRTPTDPGSSGSPVFNTEWEVIGLHHGGSGKTPRLRGGGDYEANEAISLVSIRRYITARGST